MDKANIIFESYNSAVEDSYNKAFDGVKPEDLSKLKETNVDEFLKKDLERWAAAPIAELGGLTPSQYFKNITDFADLVELFRLGSRMCDRNLPQPLVEQLMTYDDRAVDVLLRFASDRELYGHADDFYISLMAIRTLGLWKIDKAVNPLLQIIRSLSEDYEIMVEEIADALINIGEIAVEPITYTLKGADEIGYTDEYVLTALVKIGINNKSDKIFKCLKETFKKMDDKILGAMCLGDYGDGRAIPGLKGYVEKHWDTIDKATYLEIIGAVKHLGGSIDDIIKYEYVGSNLGK